MAGRLIPRVLRRAADLDAREIRFRAREALRSATEAVHFARGERWQHATLERRLASDRHELDVARRALRAEDWRTAHAALRDHLRARTNRFLLDPQNRSGLVAGVLIEFPDAREHATLRAERVLEGRYDLLGYGGLSFRTRHADVDWHADPVHRRRAPMGFWRRVPFLDPRSGDHKIIWELNRHQHWLALGRAAWLTGNRRYTAAISRELESWLRANPPLNGINWSSMLELAFRSISWIWALHFLLGMEEHPEDRHATWLVSLLAGLDRQLEHVSRHLSVYFSPNTHLLGEALSLYVAGRVLPELAAASKWEALGRGVLVDQIASQVLADGGHAERSAHYHRYTLDFYLLALSVARRTGDPAELHFTEAVSRLAWFCRSMADETGRLARIGDDDGGSLFPICGRDVADASDSLALAAALLRRGDLAIGPAPEEVLWMLGGDRDALPRSDFGATVPSQLFADTGYAVLRRQGSQAIVDVGQHGFLNGGHAHADALSLVLTVQGTPLLIDPGTATYTMEPEVRDRFRSSAMHNTVVVDGRPQSLPDGPFHWQTRADARVACWRLNAAFQYVEAAHDGYLPLIHRRAVFGVADGLWIVADHLIADGDHTADVYWHFDPIWEPTGKPGMLRTRPGAHRELQAAVVSTATTRDSFLGDRAGLGSSSPVYGRIVPSLTVRFTSPLHGPATIVTAVASAAVPVQLHIEPIEISGAPAGWHIGAAALTWSGETVLAAFATPTHPQAHHLPAPYRLEIEEGVLETDARAAVLRLDSDDEPFAASLVDASRFAWAGLSALEISRPAPAEDLHLEFPAQRRLSRPVGIESSPRLG